MAPSLVEGKETVVRRPGAAWGFTLPMQHAISLTPDRTHVALSMPGGGTVFEVVGLEETDEEVVVSLGAEFGRTGPGGFGDVVPEIRGYPLPEVQEEFARLKARWERAGGDLARFNSWAQGSSWESHLSEVRRELRRLETLGA